MQEVQTFIDRCAVVGENQIELGEYRDGRTGPRYFVTVGIETIADYTVILRAEYYLYSDAELAFTSERNWFMNAETA